MIVKQLITRLGFKNDESGYRKYKNTQNKAKRDSERFVRSIKSDHIAMHRRIIASHGRMARNMASNLVRLKAKSARTYNSMLSHARSTFSKMAASQRKASMGGMGKAAMGIGAAYAGYSAVKGIGTSIFNAGAEYERLNAALITVTGSQANATKEFAKLEKFAKSTPYNLDKSVEAFIKLKALGLDPSERSLKSYGNTASSMGKDLMQMIEAVADASTGEFERLKEFGIKTSRQGDNVTFTFRGVKTTVRNNSKEIQDYLLKLGEVQFAGGMERQAKTIGGLVSTMQDSFGALARKLWKGGLDVQAKKFVKWLTSAADNAIPFIKSLAPLKKYLPAIAGTLGFFLARFAGLKLILAGGWLLKMVSAFRSLTLLSIGAFALPAAITAAVVAVGYLGYEIYKFATTGKGLIKNLSDKFPAFGKAVEGLKKAMIDLWVEVKPYAMEFWELMKQLGEWLYTEGAKAFKWLYKEAIIPMIIEGIKWLTQFVKDWVDGFKTIIQWGQDWYSGYKTIMEWFRKTIKGLSDDFNYWYDGMVGIFDYIKEKFDWLVGAAGRVGNAVKGAFDWLGFGGGDAGNGSITDNPNFPLNNKAAAELVKNARTVFSGAKRCLNGVWQAYDKTFKAGHSGTRALVSAGTPAAEAAKFLAKSKEFQEVKVTPEMLKDPTYAKLLHGATAVYNRKSGFSKAYGHIEIWDMLNKQALFGTKRPGALNRSAHNLQNARVFLPVPAGTGGRSAINMQQYININGPTDPNTVGGKIKDKTREALDKANRSTPKRTNGLAYTQ